MLRRWVITVALHCYQCPVNCVLISFCLGSVDITLHKSTIDRIITLCSFFSKLSVNIVVRYGLLTLTKAPFDSVAAALFLGLPPKLVDLFKALFTDTLSCVSADGCDLDWFLIGSIE